MIATKINRMIVDNRKRALIKANSSDTSKLWALLRKTDNWGSKTFQLDLSLIHI